MGEQWWQQGRGEERDVRMRGEGQQGKRHTTDGWRGGSGGGGGMGLILALERIIKLYYHNGSAMQLPHTHRRPFLKKGKRNERAGEGGEERMHKLTSRGRNSERKTSSRGREGETVVEANRIRMGECEWESLA